MVGLHKNCLKIALGKAMLNLEQIRALVYQISDNLNNRPLMQQLAEENQILILTPNILIKPYASQSIYNLDPSNTTGALKAPVLSVSSTTSKKELVPEILTQLYNAIQSRLTKAIESWKKDYINVLKERATFHHAKAPGESSDTPEIGEVVLVEIPSSRNEWPLGLIIRINYFTKQAEIPANIESVVVRVNHKEVISPLTRIIPLEIKPVKDKNIRIDPYHRVDQPQHDVDYQVQDFLDDQIEDQQREELQKSLRPENKENEFTKVIQNPNNPKGRPRRLAARKARENITKWCQPKGRTQQFLLLGTKIPWSITICLVILTMVTTTVMPTTLSTSIPNKIIIAQGGVFGWLVNQHIKQSGAENKLTTNLTTLVKASLTTPTIRVNTHTTTTTKSPTSSPFITTSTSSKKSSKSYHLEKWKYSSIKTKPSTTTIRLTTSTSTTTSTTTSSTTTSTTTTSSTTSTSTTPSTTTTSTSTSTSTSTTIFSTIPYSKNTYLIKTIKSTIGTKVEPSAEEWNWYHSRKPNVIDRAVAKVLGYTYPPDKELHAKLKIIIDRAVATALGYTNPPGTDNNQPQDETKIKQISTAIKKLAGETGIQLEKVSQIIQNTLEQGINHTKTGLNEIGKHIVPFISKIGDLIKKPFAAVYNWIKGAIKIIIIVIIFLVAF
jgi:hypothetical protein